MTPRSLRENEHALPLPPHLLRRRIECLNSGLAIRPIDEHRPTERHEPAQEGHILQTRFRSHGAVFGENGGQQQHVQSALVVSDQHARPRGEVFGALDDVESDPRGESHGVVEGAGGGPLGDAVAAEQAEEEGGEDAVGGAEDEGAVGGEDAGVEGGEGVEGEGREEVEAYGRANVGGEEEGEVVKYGEHPEMRGVVLLRASMFGASR